MKIDRLIVSSNGFSIETADDLYKIVVISKNMNKVSCLTLKKGSIVIVASDKLGVIYQDRVVKAVNYTKLQLEQHGEVDLAKFDMIGRV